MKIKVVRPGNQVGAVVYSDPTHREYSPSVAADKKWMVVESFVESFNSFNGETVKTLTGAAFHLPIEVEIEDSEKLDNDVVVK